MSAVLRLYEYDETDAVTDVAAVSNLAEAEVRTDDGRTMRVRLASNPTIAQRHRRWHATLYTALLLAGREGEARTVPRLTLDVMRDAATRDAFADAANR